MNRVQLAPEIKDTVVINSVKRGRYFYAMPGDDNELVYFERGLTPSQLNSIATLALEVAKKKRKAGSNYKP